jgi:hypothetical protein
VVLLVTFFFLLVVEGYQDVIARGRGWIESEVAKVHATSPWRVRHQSLDNTLDSDECFSPGLRELQWEILLLGAEYRY